MTASVNGVAVTATAGASVELAAVRELLRQRAVAVGLLDVGAIDDTQVGAAIEALLTREVTTPVPTEAECRRYYEQHRQEFTNGDLVHARHILFQVTPRVNVPEVRARAEQALNELLREPGRFAVMAGELSNCPSGAQGGNLGQLSRDDTVPEFERALFRLDAVGILPELVRTRFGFHIVAVDRSIPGSVLPFEAVRDRIARILETEVEERAIRQYVSILAGQAEIDGVSIDAARSPLVQ
jgi:peptidyl-prolyl cis-trans isomerase C